MWKVPASRPDERQGDIRGNAMASPSSEAPDSLQRCVDQNESPWARTPAPDGRSANSSGPPERHLKRAKPRRALHAGTQCAAEAHLR